MRGEQVPPTRAVTDPTATPTKLRRDVPTTVLADCVETQQRLAGPSPPVGPPPGVGVATARIARGARAASFEKNICENSCLG